MVWLWHYSQPFDSLDGTDSTRLLPWPEDSDASVRAYDAGDALRNMGYSLESRAAHEVGELAVAGTYQRRKQNRIEQGKDSSILADAGVPTTRRRKAASRSCGPGAMRKRLGGTEAEVTDYIHRLGLHQQVRRPRLTVRLFVYES